MIDLLLPSHQSFIWCLIVLPLVIVLIPAVYSYFCYRAEKMPPEIRPHDSDCAHRVAATATYRIKNEFV